MIICIINDNNNAGGGEEVIVMTVMMACIYLEYNSIIYIYIINIIDDV